MAVLDELVAAAHERARQLRGGVSRRLPPRPSFVAALTGRERIKVIAEFKRRSPSEDEIAPELAVEGQVARYRDSGAAAISVLTEPTRFGGAADDLLRAADTVSLPLLMKDFFVDPAQVRFAAQLGASAVLLIVRCLVASQLDELAAACRDYSVAALVECHDEVELGRALAVPDAVIGINNRSLDTLSVDRGVASRLLPMVPTDRIAVAESGYAELGQVAPLRGLANAVLVGTSLMRCADPAVFIAGVSR